jgi:hypothetical protein
MKTMMYALFLISLNACLLAEGEPDDLEVATSEQASKQQSLIAPTAFINVLVTRVPHTGANGQVSYTTTYAPDLVSVVTPDTVINYQLVPPTPDDIVFVSATVSPADNTQLSEPVISQSGKMVTFSNANTEKQTFQIAFGYSGGGGGATVNLATDPEVDNEPRPK